MLLKHSNILPFFFSALLSLFLLGCSGQGFNGNNVSGWGAAGTDPISSGGGVSNPPSTGSINTANRQAVINAYNAEFNQPTPDMGFTGDIQNCVAGTTSLQYQQATINRINFYRSMIGLKPTTLIPNLTNYNQAALMMAANGQLSHSPPSSWRCYSSEGASGAGSSNLALGASGPGAIDIYIDDFGGNNSAVGHRRWIILPSQSAFATGDVPGANSLAVWQGSNNTTPEGLQFVAWPSAGYFPASLIPGSNRWSFSAIGGSMSSAKVSMKNLTTGADISITMEPFYSGYGAETIVWLPQGVSRYSTTETTYLIQVSDVQTSTGAKSYSYTVTTIGTN